MAKTAHGTTTANTVSTVTIVPGEEGIVVVNRDLTGALWVRIDGQDPTIGGADSYVVLGAREFPLSRVVIQRQWITVKLIADTARSYTVEAIE